MGRELFFVVLARISPGEIFYKIMQSFTALVEKKKENNNAASYSLIEHTEHTET